MGSRLLQLESSIERYKKDHGQQGKRRAPQASVAKSIRSRSFDRISYTVPGTIAVVPQPTNMTCWAAAYTALINWRDQQSRSIENVLSDVGRRWVDMFLNNQGLPPGEHDAFARDAGLQTMSNINLSLQGWSTLLRDHGPVFVVVDMRPGAPGGFHARIICGVHEGSGPSDTELDIVDPGRGGQRYRERLSVFLERYEAEVTERGRARTQIMYLPAGAARTMSRQKSTSARNLRRMVGKAAAASLRPVYAFTAIDYAIPGNLQGIAQPSGGTAWAALYTMMLSWKEGKSVSITDALARAGNPWQDLFTRGETPDTTRLTDFLAQTGLIAEPPASAPSDQLEQKLRDFGPLILARAGQWQLSGQILSAIQGDGTPGNTRLTLIDPSNGRSYQLTLADLTGKLSQQSGSQGGIQLIHWPRGSRTAAGPQTPGTAQSFTPSRSLARNRVFPGVIAMNQSFDIRYEVQLVPQAHQMSCWAAGFAMIVGWRQQMSIDPREIAAGIGYWRQYYRTAEQGGGLPPDDTNAISHWGFVAEPPQTYTVDGFRRLLEDYGPLWTAAATPGAHIRVVTGIHGDGTPEGTFVHINDPGPVNQGSQYTESYRRYVERQSTLASREMNVPGAIYVAHLPGLPEWLRQSRARSLSFTLMPTQFALTTITHAGPYRLAYDRLSSLGYGVIEPLPGRDTRNFRGEPALQTALNNWAALIPTIMNPAPAYILTGGLYVDKSGAHGQGLAVDVDGFYWSDANKFMALNAPTDWWRYLRIEATLRKHFGTVLNYDYNRAHQDHWHCDLGSNTTWRGVSSQVKFVQRALNEIWRETLPVDGQFTQTTQDAARRAGYDLSQESNWQRFLDNIITQQSTPA